MQQPGVIEQPGDNRDQPTVLSAPTGSYLTSLFSCFSNMGICCKGCWCPCLLIASNANYNTECSAGVCLGSALGFCTCCECYFRGHLRQHYNIPASCCNDFLASFCCMSCAACQDANEIQKRCRSAGAPPTLLHMGQTTA
ncbi:hypothetical protein PAPYR_6925 [Paratrimastix pyriformis]|uniref:Uncharacterized protein n=1 Tax=Paratrimastix pyriformis TaxID=342808 RepID=A0ABQ8UGQ5_9EUKA|nr:hypothetical protein PAPYR_6925 [Paratrimastix pyriformis]|eukprot:GAFH01006139.1.p1 GENE.GAFH01006139.1~~GAFH01006139.1.p1  ORF type:complete len:140 (-),score=7.25 GAFH01006139.1:83-502(-)